MLFGPAEYGSEEIRRAGHASRAPIEHMRVDHRGLHVTVALLFSLQLFLTFKRGKGWLSDHRDSEYLRCDFRLSVIRMRNRRRSAKCTYLVFRRSLRSSRAPAPIF